MSDNEDHVSCMKLLTRSSTDTEGLHGVQQT